jgi:small-conductance mechanosensitive channel
MKEFLNQAFLGNTVADYLVSAGIFVVGIIIIRIIRNFVLKRMIKWSKKTKTKIDDFLVTAIEKNIIPLLYFGSFYLAIENIYISSKVLNIINIILIIIVTFFLLKTISSVINYLLKTYIRRKSQGESREKELRGITTIINILIWTLGLVFLLDNLGFKVSAVITGLGVGGIAVALAAQAILGDLFAYFVIFFDRPFEIGDFIIVGDKVGAVEYIGLKTTRVRSLGGEQLVFSNKDLTDSRIHNYKKMERRRVVFKLGVIYQTKAEVLEEIPKIVRSIIEGEQDTVFDRGHFASYGDFSLNFEFVYYVIGADYNKYMDIQQDINLKIYREFEQRGIEFAYPTQTIFVEK